MKDRFREWFFWQESEARAKLAETREDYIESGMYACAGGFLVWAEGQKND
jgi:hypothetical protein